MLHLKHPEIYARVSQIPSGLLAFKTSDASILAIKASARALLAGKGSGGLKLYFAPVICGGLSTYCLLTAFPDGTNSPLLVWTPLYEDPDARTLLAVLSAPRIELFLLDEKNRPWLSYIAVAPDRTKLARFSQKLQLAPRDMARTTSHDVIDQASAWFSRGSEREDRRAFNLSFIEAVMREDLVMLHAGMRDSFYGEEVRHAELGYANPGDRQEPDLAEELARKFGGGKVFLNPLKLPNMEELCDTMVVGAIANFYFQFKSSPNTDATAKRDTGRLRTTIVHHVAKAVEQTGKCIDYVGNPGPFTIALRADRKFRAPVHQHGKNAIFVIVTHETIRDDLAKYASEILPLAERATRVICHVAETDLYKYLHFCATEEEFFKLLVADFSYMRVRRAVYDQRFSALLRLEAEREKAERMDTRSGSLDVAAAYSAPDA